MDEPHWYPEIEILPEPLTVPRRVLQGVLPPQLVAVLQVVSGNAGVS